VAAGWRTSRYPGGATTFLGHRKGGGANKCSIQSTRSPSFGGDVLRRGLVYPKDVGGRHGRHVHGRYTDEKRSVKNAMSSGTGVQSRLAVVEDRRGEGFVYGAAMAMCESAVVESRWLSRWLSGVCANSTATAKIRKGCKEAPECESKCV
jgi:hypothetical protein